MSIWDWLVVIALNGAVIGWGIKWAFGGVRTSDEWFLAGRGLPWWIIGISMYATAIDASDLVADSGGAYTLGLSMFAINWIGVVSGSLARIDSASSTLCGRNTFSIGTSICPPVTLQKR